MLYIQGNNSYQTNFITLEEQVTIYNEQKQTAKHREWHEDKN